MPTRLAVPTLLTAILLSSCTGIPAPLAPMFHPTQQVRHGGSDVALAFYRLGRQHQEAGDLKLALSAYGYASARDPGAAAPRMAAAVIHAQQGRLAQARAMLLAVCAEYPDLAQPLNNLGYVHYLEGDYAAAAQAFRDALARDPASERARNNLRLAEGAGVRGAAAVATGGLPSAPAAAAAQAAAPPAPADPPLAAAGGLRLLRMAPNVYELRTAAADAAPAAHPAPRAGQAARIEIANGHGAAGLARRFQQTLAAHGIVAARLTNARPFGQPETWIEFAPGQEAAARGLRAVLGGKAMLRQAGRDAAPDRLRLVLGRNAVQALAAAARPQAPALLAASASSPSSHPLQ